MNKNAEVWIKALRSGEYSQITGSLSKTERDGSGSEETGFCCLGVACDLFNKFIMIEGELDRWVSPERKTYNDSGSSIFVRQFKDDSVSGECGYEDAQLPHEVQSWLGLTSNSGEFKESIGDLYSLADLNDTLTYSFDEIADIIEKEPDGLFIVAKERVELV